MMAAGITHDGTLIPGTVEDIQWGEWQRAVQYSTIFGLGGVVAMDGGRKVRDWVAPMLLHNSYVSQAALDAALETFDELIGTVGTYIERDPSNNITRTLTNVEFLGLIPGIKRHDSDIGWWTKCQARFQQLQPST